MKRLLSLALVCGTLVVSRPARAEDKPPYEDLQSVGGIALCDLAGKAVTSGSVDARPFVWKAVSTVAAPSPYGGPGASAVLSYVQPVQGSYPDRWNNDALTAATEYDPKRSHPTAVATGHDETLRELLALYPATWDGYVELRLHWGAREVGFDNERFVSTSIQVEGSRWHLVGPSQGDCSKGKGRSTEVTVAGIDPTAPPTPGANATGGPASPAAVAGSSGTDARGTRSEDLSGSAPLGAVSTWGDVLPRVAAALVALVLGGAAVSTLRRRRAVSG